MDKGAGVTVPVAVCRVNAENLIACQGKYVSIMGYVEVTDKSGRSFRMKTSDQKSILVHMKSMIGEPLDGLIEVEGNVLSGNAIDCVQYTLFGNTYPTFDMRTFDEAVSLCHSMPQFYPTKE